MSAGGVSDVVLNFDASRINGATQLVVEISHPDEFFDYLMSSYRQKKLCHYCLTEFAVRGVKGKIRLPRNIFPRPADYQICVAALDDQGQMIGYVSDPLTIRIISCKPI